MSCTALFERETCKRTSTRGELADNSRTSFSLEATHQESIGPASLYLAECRWEEWLTLMSDQGFIVYLEIRHELPSLAVSAELFDSSSLSLLLFVVARFDSGSCCCFKWFLSPKSFHHLCLFYFIFIVNCLSCLSFGPQYSGGPLRASHVLHPTVLFLFSSCPAPQSWNKSK